MKKHKLLKEYTNVLLNGTQNLLVVKGHFGMGKTYTIGSILKELDLKDGINYQYISGYITPKQLFNVLSSCRIMEKPKLFWFDDIEGVLGNKTSIALLKSALWEVNGKRLVSYQTSKNSDELPAFEFNGKVILVVNSLNQEKVLGRSLLDRGIYYDMTLDPEEVVYYIENMVLPNIEKDIPINEKWSVWEKVKRFVEYPNFSIRCLYRAFSFYKHNKNEWYKLFTTSMK